MPVELIGYEDSIGYEDEIAYDPAVVEPPPPPTPFVPTLPRTVTLQAVLATIPAPTYVTARTVVALPPSTLDLYGGGGYGGYAEGYFGYDTLGTDEMRVYDNGALIRRSYDPVSG